MTRNFLDAKRVASRCSRSVGIPALLVGSICLTLARPTASAQSQSGHSQSSHSQSAQSQHYSVTHYKSAGHIHSIDKNPHSVPSSVVPEVIGKSSARTEESSQKELEHLEHASLLKPEKIGHTPVSGHTHRTSTNPHAAQHSEPINFTHKELQTTHPAAQPKVR